MKIITRWDRTKPRLAAAFFGVGLSVLIIGLIGFTSTTYNSMESLVSDGLSTPDGEDFINTIYVELNTYCRSLPGNQTPGGINNVQLPFTINCSDIKGLDLEGFRQYIADTTGDMLLNGELAISDVMGDNGDGGQDELEAFITSYLTGNAAVDDPLASIHGDLERYCQIFPGDIISAESMGGELPFSIDCTDIDGLDSDGFRGYFATQVATALWDGELAIADVLGGDEADGLTILEEFITSSIGTDQYQLSIFYLELSVTCFLSPQGTITQSITGADLPFAINCTDIQGLDEQGFIDYFIETLAYKLMTGDVAIAELLEDQGGYDVLDDFIESYLAEDAGAESPLFDVYDDFREYYIETITLDLLNGNISMAEVLGDGGDDLLHQFITSYLTPEPGEDDTLADAYDSLAMFCQYLPDGSLTGGTGGDVLPFNMSCAEIEGFNENGFRGYFVELITGMLWQGELAITEVLGDEAEELEESFYMLTENGNTTFLIIFIAGVPLTLGGCAVLFRATARMRWLRTGQVLSVVGGFGLLASVVLFFLLPVSRGVTEVEYQFTSAGVFTPTSYFVLLAVTVLGLLFVAAYMVKHRSDGRSKKT